ncbi:MAG: DUF2782 domain-containing protein [Proteobacteria bacterium]|nr:DUF2782 domain-containing protein [Pseudomonadota bacterium]
MKRLLISLGLLFASPALLAGDTNPEGLEPVPEPPILPDPLEKGESIESQITIIHKEDAVIEEYRVNGYLYKVKVTPAFGPIYYLIDHNGDGQLTRHELEDLVVPQWVLFTW